MAQVTVAAPGEAVLNTRPGDFILTHRRALPSKIIALGQRIRFRGSRRLYAHWSHAALVVSTTGDLIEALAPGLVFDSIDRYRHVEYHYINTELDDRDRQRVLNYALTMWDRHERYDWLEILSLGLQLLTAARVTLTTENHAICSGFVASALERTDAVFPRTAGTMLPADLAAYYHIQP